MFIKLYEKNTNPKQVREVVDIIQKGGIVIYPTDSVYAMGCDMNCKSAVLRIAQLRGLDPKKSHFSIISSSISQIAEYTKQIDTPVFKLLKNNLPGPFTFILNAGSAVPSHFKSKRKQIGVRIPDNNIVLEIVRELGRPIMTTSIKSDDEILEYSTDPELIWERFENKVDCLIDGGYGNLTPSTIVDCSGSEPEIIRQGIGELR